MLGEVRGVPGEGRPGGQVLALVHRGPEQDEAGGERGPDQLRELSNLWKTVE